ncbi:MAG: hypothetical protein V1806_14700 [Pseudomonadota bacterium]
MGDGNVNLPQVIQQSGDVSRLQENVQRAGEQQQMAAGAEALRQQQRERSSVQRSDRSGTQNRVRPDRQGQGQGAEAQPRRRRAGPPVDQPTDQPPERPGGGGVLDVVV